MKKGDTGGREGVGGVAGEESRDVSIAIRILP